MSGDKKPHVIIENSGVDLREPVERIMSSLAPDSFSGANVLIKPNMVGPSEPGLGHTTHPDLVRAVVRACLDRNASVIVGDNPGGISRSSRNVANATGILDASEDCFHPISEQVVEKKGIETGFPMVISKSVLDADYIINLPKFKTHTLMMVTGAIKNTYGYIAGACKAKLHLQAPNKKDFAKTICDIYQLRPPDLHIMDAITAIEGNGPCHGGMLREVGKILGSTDPLALDAVMAQMMGVEPSDLPVQKEAAIRGLGSMKSYEIEVAGLLEQIPNFRMPVTFYHEHLDNETIEKLQKLYPPGMMLSRTKIIPLQNVEKCALCGDCVLSCPTEALTIEPEFSISDKCIACYCCVELCPEGALEVPDVEAYRHY
ncbi:MAG: DUF362 domain-containing protein [Deltaproteobacteria bacterium]|nr:DUF362 domain-containing protein [Deltaproteobacteria bacterium]